MDKKLLDLNGVTHWLEKGVWHNTFCGQMLHYGTVLFGDDLVAPVNCLACLGGPSHTTIEDLLHGDDVPILLAGLDREGRTVTAMVRVQFSNGTNLTPVKWTGIADGTEVVAVGYYRRDFHQLHVTKLNQPFTVRHPGDLVEINEHGISLVEGPR